MEKRKHRKITHILPKPVTVPEGEVRFPSISEPEFSERALTADIAACFFFASALLFLEEAAFLFLEEERLLFDIERV